MVQKIIDIGRNSTQYLLTLLFAAIGTYVGMQINLAEMKAEQKYLRKDVDRIENAQSILWETTYNLQTDNAIICKELGIERTRGAQSKNGKE